MAHELSTLGIKVYWVAAPAGDTIPLTGWDLLAGVKSLPDYDSPPAMIDVTDLAETEYHRYIPGLKDISDAYTMTANFTQDNLDEWGRVVDAYSETNVIWISINIPGLNKAFYFYGQPVKIGMPAAEVNTALEVNFNIIPNKIISWSDKVAMFNPQAKITYPTDGGTYQIGDNITGTAMNSATVQVKVGTQDISPTIQALADNTFSVKPSTDIASGKQTFQVKQTINGDTSPYSSAITAEAKQPVAVSITTPAADGTYLIGDNISGSAMAGATIKVKIAGQDILPNPKAKSDNTWSFVPTSTLSTGIQSFQAAQNVDGNLSDYTTAFNANIQPNFSTAVAVTTTAFATGYTSGLTGADTSIKGSATHGSTVKLYKDNFDTPISDTVTASSSNDFSIVPTSSITHGSQIQMGATQTLYSVANQSAFAGVNCVNFVGFSGLTSNNTVTAGTATPSANITAQRAGVNLSPTVTAGTDGKFTITYDTALDSGQHASKIIQETFGITTSVTIRNK